MSHCCCCCYAAAVVSDSVRPHRRQPSRLPRPWDSPGKNTGVACHFLLQGFFPTEGLNPNQLFLGNSIYPTAALRLLGSAPNSQSQGMAQPIWLLRSSPGGSLDTTSPSNPPSSQVTLPSRPTPKSAPATSCTTCLGAQAAILPSHLPLLHKLFDTCP